MNFRRTTDYWHVREILTHRDIYPLIGDDYVPAVEEFEVNMDPRIRYILAADQGLVALFSFFPENRICWSSHVVLTPWATKLEKLEAGRGLVPWLRQNTECRRMTAAIPATNRPAVYFATQVVGMKYVGRQEKAFQKGGELRDLILLGLSLNGG